MKNYDTVTEAVKDLKAQGFNIDFNLAFDKLICSADGTCLNPHEFEIVEIHRFEGQTNPSDEDVVYAVKSKNEKVKGVLTSAFGVYADEISEAMAQKLSIK